MVAIKKPIRMCIVCKGRFEQKTLIRFQITNGKFLEFSKVGRSNYICSTCICLEERRLIKIFNGRFKLKYKKIIEFGDYFPDRVRKYKKEIGPYE